LPASGWLTLTDNGDGTAALSGTPTGDDVAGPNDVTLEVVDGAGLSDTQTFSIVFADTTPPEITLIGPDTVTLTVGDTYVEEGATATDLTDGDISADIVIDSSAVDTGTAGTYTVTYNVSDAAGNPAAEVTRSVIVNDPDTTPPVITLNGSATVTLTVGDTYVIVIDSSAVDTGTAGTYTVTYSVSDSSGNAAQATRTVTVIDPDTTPPVITLNGSATVTLTVGGTYTEQGATATDDTDGDISASIVIDSSAVDTGTAGT
jgi:hypothetical protein